MNAAPPPTIDPNLESNRCIVCFEPIHPQAKVCSHCHSPQKPKRWRHLGLVLKWLGGATAVLSLVAGVLQINELLRASRQRDAAIENLVGAAELQMDSGDLKGALIMLQEASELDPANSKARVLRAKIAADRVRNYYAPINRNHHDEIDPLIPVLFRGAASTDAVTSADMLAHIGWANHIRSRKADIQRPVQYYFEKALERDPDNVFAHTFWANWCLSNYGRPDCGDNLQTAIAHYTSARKSERQQDYLSDVYSFTLAVTTVEGASLYWVSEVAKQLSGGRSIDEGIRRDIRSKLYRLTLTEEDLHHLFERIPPRDVLTLVDWATDPVLTKRKDWPDVALRGFLQEEVGDTEKAFETYRAVRLMIRQEEMRRQQRGYSKLRARIDLRLAGLLDLRPPSLGIRQQELTDELAVALGMPESRGIFVAEVVRNGPAHQAGVKRGDVILSIDGNAIEIGWRDVLEKLDTPMVGDEVDLLLIQDGRESRVRVQLGEKDLAEVQKPTTFGDTDTVFSRILDRTLYNTQVLEFAAGKLVVVDLSADLRKAFDTPGEEDGVLVFSNRNKDIPLKSSDLIQEIEGQPVRNITELQDVIAQVSGNGYSRVLIKRLRRGEEAIVPVILRNR